MEILKYLIITVFCLMMVFPLWMLFSPFLCFVSKFGDPYIKEVGNGKYKIVKNQYVFGFFPLEMSWGYDELGCGGWGTSFLDSLEGDVDMSKKQAKKQLQSLKKGDQFTYIFK